MPNSLLAAFGVQTDENLAVSDGYWLMVEPLTPGEHTITFGGQIPGGNSQNNIYTITVLAVLYL